MKGALVVDAVVRDGKIHICDEDFYRTRSARFAKHWGDGASLKIRIEPEDEAAQWSDWKYLFGYVFTPVSEDTGHTIDELCLMAKVKFMPDDGRTSLTQLNREELKEFTRATEEWLRTERPEAYEKYGREYIG